MSMPFNKKTPLYAGLGLKQKTFSILGNFFSQSECTDRLNPSSPSSF